MRVGIDYRPVFRPNSRRRGIGKFTASQVNALVELGGHEYVLYTISRERPGLAGPVTWRELPQIRRPGRLNWLLDRFRLHQWINRDGLDVYHATEVTALPSRCACPLIVTVHDVIPLVFWDQMKFSMPVDYRIGLRDAYRRVESADRILTISRSARQDICSHLGIEEGKIEVVYPGCDPLFRPVDRESARARISRYGIRDRFLFYVGGSDFRKNLRLLIRGFARVREQGYRGALVLAGETFVAGIPEVEDLRDLIRRLGLEDSVLCPGYVTDEDLPAFYSACDVFVFPSLYEGFGLPVLEAMACGAAVVASNTSSIPEVGGEDVEYMDPQSPEDLVSGVLGLLESPERRERMRVSGPARASAFSWREGSLALISLYNSLG